MSCAARTLAGADGSPVNLAVRTGHTGPGSAVGAVVPSGAILHGPAQRDQLVPDRVRARRSRPRLGPRPARRPVAEVASSSSASPATSPRPSTPHRRATVCASATLGSRRPRRPVSWARLDRVEDPGQRARGVEIVVHVGAEAIDLLGARSPRPGQRPVRRATLPEAAQVLQAEPTGQAVEPVERLLGVGSPCPASPRSATGTASGERATGRRGGRRARASRPMVTKLPSDLDILSAPTITHPLCTQCRANGRPSATAWARSFSWCGKMRSMPAAVEIEALAETGRATSPRTRCATPDGRSRRARPRSARPALAAFHSAKSSGERLSSSIPTRAPGSSELRATGGRAVRSLRPGRTSR